MAVAWHPYLWTTSRGATRRDIERVESALGLAFPLDYRELVMRRQGEVPRPGVFDVAQGSRTTSSVMGVLFHFLDEESAPDVYSYNLLESYRNRRHLLPDLVIPFSEDPAGNSIAFDFRKDANAPMVVFVDHEATDESSRIWPIAPNVSALLRELREDDEA